MTNSLRLAGACLVLLAPAADVGLRAVDGSGKPRSERAQIFLSKILAH